MERKKIYVVNDCKDDSVPQAVFDSKEKALEFVSRFKQNKRYIVYEHDLNPSFVKDEERTPYEVTFYINGEVRISTKGLGEHEVMLANEDGYEFDGETLFCYTIAENEAEALNKAVVTKNRLITEGEFEYMDDSDSGPVFRTVSLDDE